MPDDFYGVLGVAPNASSAEIAAAYRALAKRYHPDLNRGGAEMMKRINAAYYVLSDPERRAAYDRDRAEGHSASGHGASGHSAASGWRPPRPGAPQQRFRCQRCMATLPINVDLCAACTRRSLMQTLALAATLAALQGLLTWTFWGSLQALGAVISSQLILVGLGFLAMLIWCGERMTDWTRRYGRTILTVVSGLGCTVGWLVLPLVFFVAPLGGLFVLGWGCFRLCSDIIRLIQLRRRARQVSPSSPARTVAGEPVSAEIRVTIEAMIEIMISAHSRSIDGADETPSGNPSSEAPSTPGRYAA
ncbi:MAG: J domain-containing protein [Candidatus Dormibacteraceae bacterium]